MSDTLISSSALSPPSGTVEDPPALVLTQSPDGDGLSPSVLDERGRESITRDMKVALVKMMFRNDQAKEVIAQLEKFGKAQCAGVDYFKLARLGLAEQRNCSYHRLTAKGRLAAKDALIELARADDIHALDYQFETPTGIAPFVRCSCGWCTRKSKYYASHRLILHRFGEQHLRFVGAK
jgi:hypothetical protein